jgi:hypothetical protein
VLEEPGHLTHSSLDEVLKHKTSYSMMLASCPTPNLEDLWTRLSLAPTLSPVWLGSPRRLCSCQHSSRGSSELWSFPTCNMCFDKW